MVASLLKIFTSGVQDGRLCPPKSQPNIAFFSKVFIRAGRFTTQWVRIDFDNNPTFGNTAVCTLPRKGHLITRMYLVTTMPDIYTVQAQAQTYATNSSNTFLGPQFGWTNSLGHALINETYMEIGGARVERFDGRLLEILDEFYSPLEKQTVTNKLIKRKDNGFNYTSFGNSDENPTTVVTPLPYWFCGDSGLALPIDAIQADAIKLYVTFNNINSCYVSSGQVNLPNTLPVGGDAYFPLSNSSFYVSDSNGSLVYGLNGNPNEGINASKIPGIVMPNNFNLGSTYLLVEYVYLDAPEANRFRLSDIRVPVTQHYIFDPVDSQNMNRIYYKFSVPNPTRNLFFYLGHYDAVRYNAPFLATRDLSGANTSTPWWPDASGLEQTQTLGTIRPAFSTRYSEPLSDITLQYEGKLIRYNTNSPSLFRSILPSLEMRKSPWVNRYYYTLMFGFNHGISSPSQPSGEANLDKMLNIELQLQLHPNTGSLNPNNVNRFFLYLYAETYNILRVYGGRAGLLFAY